MDIKIANGNGESPRIQKIRKESVFDSIIVRVFICCLVMDALIWGYFRFIRNVSVAEGIKGWQQSIRKIAGKQSELEYVRKTIATNTVQKNKDQDVIQIRPTPESLKEDKKLLADQRQSQPGTINDEIYDIEMKYRYMGKQGDTLYSWEDETGQIHYSNTGFPEGNIEKLWVRKAGN